MYLCESKPFDKTCASNSIIICWILYKYWLEICSQKKREKRCKKKKNKCFSSQTYFLHMYSWNENKFLYHFRKKTWKKTPELFAVMIAMLMIRCLQKYRRINYHLFFFHLLLISFSAYLLAWMTTNQTLLSDVAVPKKKEQNK